MKKIKSSSPINNIRSSSGQLDLFTSQVQDELCINHIEPDAISNIALNVDSSNPIWLNTFLSEKNHTAKKIFLNLQKMINQINQERLLETYFFKTQEKISWQVISDNVFEVINLLCIAQEFGDVCVASTLLNSALLKKTNYSWTMIAHQLNLLDLLDDANNEKNKLFVYAFDRLYFNRWFDIEKRIAQKIYFLIKKPSLSIHSESNKLTPLDKQLNEEVDWQEVATLNATLQNFLCISGGPGTGKTTTVRKILKELAANQKKLRVALCAPTGKAAQRLYQSLNPYASKDFPNIHMSFATVHRLLAYSPLIHQYRFHEGNFLSVDVLIIDEAAMLDFALACRLLLAIPPHAKVIFLGDTKQLPSVDAGNFFAALTSHAKFDEERLCLLGLEKHKNLQAKQHHILNNATVFLQKTYRFDSTQGIGKLAYLINAGCGDELLTWLKTTLEEGVVCDFSLVNEYYQDKVAAKLLPLLRGYQAYIEKTLLLKNDLEQYLASHQVTHHETVVFEKMSLIATQLYHAFSTYQILTADKKGEIGADIINILMNQLLKKTHFKTLNKTLDANLVSRESSYHDIVAMKDSVCFGQPLMVTQNDYQLNLFNGDIGIVILYQDKQVVAFMENDGWRFIPLSLLSSLEAAWAITVHKSQGSEYDDVALVLPKEWQPLISRELIYTAVTRAKNKVHLFAGADVLLKAIEHTIQRQSGLLDQITALTQVPVS